MATHSSTIAWKIPWTEEPGRLQSMGSQRVRHDWETSLGWDRSVSSGYIFISSDSVSPYWLRTSNIYLFPNFCIKLEFRKVGIMFYLCQLDLRENGRVQIFPFTHCSIFTWSTLLVLFHTFNNTEILSSRTMEMICTMSFSRKKISLFFKFSVIKIPSITSLSPYFLETSL